VAISSSLNLKINGSTSNTRKLNIYLFLKITLQFDDSKTELSAGLSLTIMLVMYTMYQSISQALVKTAYLKMIDYWLLFCLLMPFVIFMIEIYWLLARTQNLGLSSKGWMENENQNVGSRRVVRLVTYFASALFITVYALIAILMQFEII
jgi:hypothetical protein